MSSTEKLSLPAAVFVNLNIMLGSGIFINSVMLTKTAGALGTAVYPIAGLLILPLIVVFSLFLSQIPGGTFYEFGATIHPLVGFISSWGYFVGKLASAALSLHVFVTLMQQIHPVFTVAPALVYDGIILAIFVFLTLFNVKTGKPIQYTFFAMKVFAITLVICASSMLFSWQNFTLESFNLSGIPACLPMGLFAFAGFEATCSLSKNIQNPEKNGPRAVFISYVIVLVVLTFYQVGLFGALGSRLGALSGFQEPIQFILQRAFPFVGLFSDLLIMLAFIAIASSALGASYGILYSNIWNLHTLAEYRMIPFAQTFHRCNRFKAPLWCVFIAGLIELLYLLISKGDIIPLQQMTTFASILAYAITAAGFIVFTTRYQKPFKFIATCGIMSCLLLLAATIPNAMRFGMYPYLIYFLLLLFGVAGFVITRAAHWKHNPKGLR